MNGLLLRSIHLASAVVLGVIQTGSALSRSEALVQIIALDLGGERNLDGRLAGITAYQPFRTTIAAGQRSVRDLGPDALSAYAAIRRQLAAGREPPILRIAGQAELLMGRTSAARALFDECLAHSACPPVTWSDLAAAYLRQADEGGPETSAELTARAIDAAARATSLAPARPHVWFNLGVGLTRMHLDQSAGGAWTQYLRIESSQAWRNEARDRRARKSDVAASRWSSLKAGLISDRDVSAADFSEIASIFAQQGREFLLEELLPLWGSAWLAERWDEADARFRRAQSLAQVLERVDGDQLLRDCVARVTEASQNRVSGIGRDLARAHVAYGEGRRLFEAGRREESTPHFSNAAIGFSTARSACRAWSDAGLAVAAYVAGNTTSALQKFATVAKTARARGHWALLGRVQWTAGVTLVESSQIEAALRCLDESLAAFERAREVENAAAVAGVTAHALRLIGEHREGWRFLVRSLDRFDQVVSLRRRQVLLLNASLFSAAADLAWTALMFQDASVATATQRGAVDAIVEGLIRRADLHLKVGNLGQASADLTEAARLLPQISSTSALQYHRPRLARVRAELNLRHDPAESLRLMDEALIAEIGAREPDQVPVLHLARGRAALNAQNRDAADASFRRGLEVFQTQWRSLASREHRVSYTHETWDLFDELIRLRAIGQAGQAAALEYAEAARGQHAGLDPGSPQTLDVSRPFTPAGTEIVYYISLHDRLLAWRLGAGEVLFADLDFSRAELAQLVGAYRQAIQTAESADEVRPIGVTLYARLLQPLLPNASGVQKLVIVPDGALHALPFGSLADPVTGRFLIQDRSVVVVPSLTLYRRAQERYEGVSRAQITRTLLVGGAVNPDPLLAPLPGAAAELADLAANYRSPIVLSGLRATAAEFSRAAETAEVIHFAGHAKANLAFPWSSSLVLTPDSHHPSGLLPAREIATWKLPLARLVVLGACQTAYGPLYRGEGLISLARPFLDLGVPSVVGAMWDVDDRVTRQFLVEFHREYAATGDPGFALSAAQRRLMTSSDPTLSLPRNWSAFLTFGASGAATISR